MASVPDRLRLKDRIIANVSKAVKVIQEQCGSADYNNPVVFNNRSWQCHKLCEHLDHVFLHGLKHIGHGYWRVVTEFTRKNAVRDIQRLQNVTTDLGRGRAWLFMALNESSLESYIRCFELNEKLVRKHYVKESLVLDQQRMNVLLTLTAGLEFAVFQLDYDVAYLDLSTYPPRSRTDSDAARDGDDRVSLCSMDSVIPSRNGSSSMMSNRSNSLLADGDNVSIQSADTSSASHDSKTISVDSGYHIDKSESQDRLEDVTETRISRLENAVSVNEDCDEDLGIEVIRVKSKSKKKKVKKKSQGKHAVLKENEDDINTSYLVKVDHLDQCKEKLPENSQLYDRSPGDGMDSPVDRDSDNVLQTDICQSDYIQSSLSGSEQVGQKLTKLGSELSKLDTLQEHQQVTSIIDTDSLPADDCDSCPDNVYDTKEKRVKLLYSTKELAKLYQISFDEDKNCDISTGDEISDTVYETQNNTGDKTREEDIAQTLHKDKLFESETNVDSNYNQVLTGSQDENGKIHVTTKPTHKDIDINHFKHDVKENCDNKSSEKKSVTSQLQDRADFLVYESDICVNKGLYQEEDESLMLECEDETEPEVQDQCDGETKLDNNTLLNLMLEVFEDSEEQFVKMFGTVMGHTEGETKTVFVLITDKTIYLLYQDQSNQKFCRDASVKFTDLDYISLSVEEQVIQIVCTNRRKQFWITTGNQQVTRAIINCLSSAMENSHFITKSNLTVLTDATTQRIAMKKFVAKECHIDQTQVEVCCYSLIHWDDPLSRVGTDETFREGHMLYRIQEVPSNHFITSQIIPTSLIPGGSTWKPAYIVLREGILCIFNNKEDSKPQHFLQVGGEDCSGCRRSKNSNKDHAIEVNKTDGSSWQIAAASEHEVNDWLQSLCQAAADATEKSNNRPGCLPCCLILTPQKLLMSHEDVQTNFFRTLGSANVEDVTGISVDSVVKSFCILEFEAQDIGVVSEQWVLYFNAEFERDRFIKAFSAVWSRHFEVEIHLNNIENFSLQQTCREIADHLHSSLEVK